MHHYINQNLEQLKSFIETCPKKLIFQTGSIISSSSIGMHIRHILEFYDCLLHQASSGDINYDKRTRNLLLETSTEAMIEKIEMLQIQLEILIDSPLTLSLAYGTNINEIETHKTSVNRELGYCLEHAIHHFALIKFMVLAEIPTFEFATNFGVASSTIRNNTTTCAQ